MKARRHRSPQIEPIESRLVMSVALPANTLGVAQGVVSGPGASGLATASVTVEPSSFARGRPSTVIGLEVTLAPGSHLSPSIVSAFGPAGERLPVYQPGSLGAKLGGPATLLVQDDRPGPVTVDVVGKGKTTGAFQLRIFLPGDVDGSGHVDLADLDDLTHSYLSKVGEPDYDPSADFLQTGRIAQQDVRLLERNLSDPTPDVPLGLEVHLAPGEATSEPHLYNSGPITRKKTVTVIGKTLPFSAVIVDGSKGFYNFNGPFLPVDADGNFSYTFSPNAKFSAATSFLVIAPDGRQLVRNFPIITIGAKK